jgi:hypothetical protein
MSAPPINLNRARKAKAKSEAKTRAAENRAKFGRTKAQTTAARAEADKLARDVDGHRREPQTSKPQGPCPS